MSFSVGDKVVHPRHGPGCITGIESRDLLDGAKRYYIIDIPGQGLTVKLPVRTAGESGVRLAMSQSKLARVLNILHSKPHLLSEDYRERQEQVYAQIRTGRVIELARVVRDLTWHRERSHLTKRDGDYLKQGRDLLASEMALVSGSTVSDESRRIEAIMVDALAGATH